MYAVVDYMRVAPNASEQDYLGLEKIWQRLHQKAVNEGISRGWYLSRVENGGRNQFVTVRIYDSLDKAMAPWPESIWKGLFSEEESKTIQKTDTFRYLTRSELWQVESAAMKNGAPDTAPYITVHFMKAAPGKMGEYYELEKTLFRKAHQIRADKGQLRSWFLMSRVFPSGHDSEYDFITLNVYDSKEAAEKPWDMDAISAGLTPEEFKSGESIFAMREIVREEKWHGLAKAEK